MFLALTRIAMTLIAVVCLILAGRAMCRKTALARPAAALCISAGLACFMGMMPLVFRDTILLRVTDVVYFVSLDLSLAALLWYAGTLAGVSKKSGSVVTAVVAFLLVLDFFNFAFNVMNPVVIDHVAVVNPLLGVTMDYVVPVRTSFRFAAHMIFDYAMAVGSALFFFRKLRETPSVYRGPYYGSAIVLIAVFIINAVAVFSNVDLHFGYSSVAFAIAVIFIYWTSFHSVFNMQHAQVLSLVSESAQYPIITFDSSGRLISLNQAARDLLDLEEDYWEPLTLEDFANRYDVPELKIADKSIEFAWRQGKDEVLQYNCEYTVVKDSAGMCLGHSIVMQSAARSVDANTGLFNEESFRIRRERDERQHRYPMTVAAIGLSHLVPMNEACGRAVADQGVAAFARELRRLFPPDGTCFLGYRGSADFVFMSPDFSRDEVYCRLERLKDTIVWDAPEGIEPDFEYGVAVATGGEDTITEACHRAAELVALKRFAAKTSPRNARVTSLVRPLIDRGFTTNERIQVTSALAGQIARQMGESETVVYRSILTARLRDVGKVSIPDDVAFHTGPYTRGARLLMERHAEVGYRLINASEGLTSLADAVLHHHERWDGSGYPDGLKGDAIPIESRIVAVATSYESMVHPRSFKPTLSTHDAAKEIATYAGTQFDPSVVAAFLRAVEFSEEGGSEIADFIAKKEVDGKSLREAVEKEAHSRDGRMKALVVDDQEINRGMLCLQIEEKFDTVEAANGQEALDILMANPRDFDAVLLDLYMPVMDGFAVLERMREKGLTDKIPVVVVTADESPETLERCFDQGAAEFLPKGTDPGVILRRLGSAVELYSNRRDLERRLEEQATDIITMNDELRTRSSQLERIGQQISSILFHSIEYRDCDSAGHLDRVMGFAMAIGKIIVDKYPGYGLTEDQILPLGRAAALHDIGKIAIPDNILFKADRLTAEEFAVMKAHTVCGYNLVSSPLSEVDDDFNRFTLEIVRSHHERWDGSGYPDGLSGRDIPISAQIAALADVYDALTSDRPYKKAFAHDEAVEMILSGECGVFESTMLSVFKQAADDFPAMYEKDAFTQKIDPVLEYREELEARFRAGEELPVDIDNSAPMEYIVRLLMDSNRSLMLANRYDLATGAFNRNYYLEYLQNFNSSSVRCMAAVYFDVNGLHEYNRDFGHAQGDIMLANVVRAILDAFEGHSVFRTGGDEFVATCENTTEEDVLALIDKVRQLFDERELSCSVGYDWRNTDIDMAEMVKSADRSMFKQKSVFYEGQGGASNRSSR